MMCEPKRVTVRRWLLGISATVLCATATCADAPRSDAQVEPWTRWSGDAVREAVAPVRAGRKLSPKSWPGGAKVAVIISWDVDNEPIMLANGLASPTHLARGEYGSKSALPRIFEMHDRLQIPATFFIPQMSAVIDPKIATELRKRPQHELALHGRIHENLVTLNNEAEERRLLHEQIAFWTQAVGRRPVGFRAPGPGGNSVHTLRLLREAGLEYDSSLSAMDEPYEPLSYGQPTGLVELPVDWAIDDWLLIDLAENASVTSPELAYKVYRRDFDRAYSEGTMFMLTAHPMSSAHRARIGYLEDFIVYMRSKPGVWFATARDVAAYLKQQNATTD